MWYGYHNETLIRFHRKLLTQYADPLPPPAVATEKLFLVYVFQTLLTKEATTAEMSFCFDQVGCRRGLVRLVRRPESPFCILLITLPKDTKPRLNMHHVLFSGLN